MFTISTTPVVYDDGHHKFYYIEGKRIPKEEDPNTYLYIDRAGILHATDWADVAYRSGGGVYMIVPDEKIANKHGQVVLNNKAYVVYGIFEDFRGTGIYMTNDEKIYVDGTDKTITVHPGTDVEAVKTLYEIYKAINQYDRAYDI